MTDVRATLGNTASMSRSKERRASGKKPPLRVLAVVDGSESSGRVTKYLLDLHARDIAFEVVLLTVQSEPDVGRLRGYGSFRRAEIDDRLINDLGRRVITSAARHLDAASILHKDRIELGNTAETIVRCADEEKCDLIVLAEPKAGPVRHLLIRTTGLVIYSVASEVIHFANAPVLVAR